MINHIDILLVLDLKLKIHAEYTGRIKNFIKTFTARVEGRFGAIQKKVSLHFNIRQKGTRCMLVSFANKKIKNWTW
jgi:hypothetical protein